MKKFLVSENGNVHGFLVVNRFDSNDSANDQCAALESKHKGYNHKVHSVEIVYLSCEVADYDNEGSTVIVSVDALIDGETESVDFHVQTTDGRYSCELGCWITTPTSGDLEFSDNERLIYEAIDITSEAEKFLNK